MATFRYLYTYHPHGTSAKTRGKDRKQALSARALADLDRWLDVAPLAGVARGGIADDEMGMDIGPLSIQKFTHVLKGAKTVVWNGPVGVFEFPKFATGTVSLAKAIADLPDCITVIGGGDSVSAVNKAGVADKMSHISTGGGASLEFLAGIELPGVAALTDKPTDK